ncbi:MAG: hypothetical protein P1V20_24615 [Verrucomicrobiales bacterium]|nr:hypothetical protein [Verrucomicrobiales bacterium]
MADDIGASELSCYEHSEHRLPSWTVSAIGPAFACDFMTEECV